MTTVPELSGRVALVTGAGRGVGVGICRALAAAGAAVAVNDYFADRAQSAVADLTAEFAGTAAVAMPFDVTDYDAVVEGVARAAAALGPVDILVNNAGIPADGMALVPFTESGPAHWRQLIDLNLYGVIHCTHATVGAMAERGWGRVVTISSEAGRMGTDLPIALYGASKAGAVGLMRHLAREVAPAGVTVNCLSLGLMEGVESDWAQRVAARIPRRRLGSPDDVGATVAFLCSEGAAWITGQVLPVNGGAHT